ncbi:TetR/AcrR family transcriptional regulator [Novosphingobium album (ex Hu et al. 2023)]|uniref:TetR/AcrR family transcriptional regulator n=1 Tax=Novosphingobium album (ex Hu et al. 2023) TaxID=2930093 RepID=A0ABT0B6L3_9SPHN|nr:TetR/AcrR family transcriptional regulator [Novosphingobium album (ex Hu et al. 2023)]MCJ2180510.1 TetR/AcrR family transcriptional regulator [Novosphingobium album (ex Hu et al. 2023)]
MQSSEPLQSRPKRADHRRETTRLAIIEAAETLFAERGIDAVSLREIGAAAGAKNTAVVSYHFGDKEGLLDAILHSRLPAFDTRRAGLQAQVKGEPDVTAILRVLALPIFEQRNSQGKRSYAAFLGSLGRSQFRDVWAPNKSAIPATMELGAKLREQMPAGTGRFYEERLFACTAMLTSAIEAIDRRLDLDAEAERALFNDAIRMAAAAFTAPFVQ